MGRYWMNDEENYMNNLLEQEFELKTKEAMSICENEMRNFLAEELYLEQQFELNTNNDMIKEEIYLRTCYEELEIMEESERKLMAYDEWQQREGREIIRNAIRLKILREAKRRKYYKKAWKMYIWSLFILKSKELVNERRKAYMEKLARKVSMRHALIMESKRLKYLIYLDTLRKKYKKRRIIINIINEAKKRINLNNEIAFKKVEIKKEKKEQKAMFKEEKQSLMFNLMLREMKKYDDEKLAKIKRKEDRERIRELRRVSKLTKDKEQEELLLRLQHENELKQERINKKKEALNNKKFQDNDDSDTDSNNNNDDDDDIEISQTDINNT